MNWDAIGAIGQMLGSIAVFITLGYLATQIRHARQETSRALSQGRAEAHRDLLAQVRDERILGVQLKADAALGAQPNAIAMTLVEQAGLTLEEASLMVLTQTAWWTYRLQIIPYVDDLPAMERTAIDNQVRAAYGRPGVARLYYETYIKGTAHPDAIRYIDNLLAQLAH
jgi:hypothetical protein